MASVDAFRSREQQLGERDSRRLLKWFFSTVGVTVLFLIPSCAQGTTYKHHPGTPLRLGAGFDPIQPDRAFLPCVTGTASETTQTQAENTKFDISEIKTRRDLYTHLHIDATLSASFAFGSGGASFMQDDKYTFGSDNLYYAITAGSDYYSTVLNNPSLVPEAQALLRNPKAFQARCGAEFVYQERRTAEIVAILAFERVTESRKKHIEAAMSGSGFGFNFNGNYSEDVQNSTDKITLNVSVYAIGGTGITLLHELAEIPASTSSIDELKHTIKIYIESMDHAKAVPVEYVTAYWTSFGVAVAPRLLDKRSLVLPEMYFSYRENEITLRRLGEVIRHASDPGSTITQLQLQEYLRQYRELGGDLMRLAEQGRACLEAEDRCDPMPAPLVFVVTWPQAVFAKVWVRVDNMNHPYVINSSIRTIGWGGNASGSISIPPDQEARIYDVKYACEGYGCGWSYNPSGGYSANFTLSSDLKTANWLRFWQGEPCTNKYAVYYEVSRDVCVQNCLDTRTMQAANGTLYQKNIDSDSPQAIAMVGKTATSVKTAAEQGQSTYESQQRETNAKPRFKSQKRP